jgi:hypothetical protein
MGKFVISNGKILLNGYDLSGDHNQIGLTVSREERETTTFGKKGVQRIAGLQSFDVSGSGYFEAGTGHVDTIIAPNLGTSSAELTILPQGATIGSKGFIGEINTFEYAPGGSIGDVMGFTFAGKGEGTVLVDGILLKAGAVSSSGTTTPFQLGHSTSHLLFANLHVTSTSGTGDSQELEVVIQSDATSSFGSPTNRITFSTSFDTPISEWKSTTMSSSTDTWWRVSWVSSGTNEGFTFYVTAGISYL